MLTFDNFATNLGFLLHNGIFFAYVFTASAFVFSRRSYRRARHAKISCVMRVLGRRTNATYTRTAYAVFGGLFLQAKGVLKLGFEDPKLKELVEMKSDDTYCSEYCLCTLLVFYSCMRLNAPTNVSISKNFPGSLPTPVRYGRAAASRFTPELSAVLQ